MNRITNKHETTFRLSATLQNGACFRVGQQDLIEE